MHKVLLTALVLLLSLGAQAQSIPTQIAITGMQDGELTIFFLNGTTQTLTSTGELAATHPEMGFLYSEPLQDSNGSRLIYYDGNSAQTITDDYLDGCLPFVTADNEVIFMSASNQSDPIVDNNGFETGRFVNLNSTSLNSADVEANTIGKMINHISVGGGGGGRNDVMNDVADADSGFFPSGYRQPMILTEFGVLRSGGCDSAGAWLTNINTGGEDELIIGDTYITQFALSPDGTRLAAYVSRFVGGEASQTLYIYDLATRYDADGVDVVTLNQATDFGDRRNSRELPILWGDDGNIYYAATRAIPTDYGLTDADLEQLEQDGLTALFPEETRKVQIYQVNPESGAVRQIHEQDQVWGIGRMYLVEGTLYFSLIPDAIPLIEAWRAGTSNLQDRSVQARFVQPDIYQLDIASGNTSLIQEAVLRFLPVRLPE